MEETEFISGKMKGNKPEKQIMRSFLREIHTKETRNAIDIEQRWKKR